MLRIGDFSRLAQVSIKTLRYYDETGLLKPAEVDHFTGYRYYTLDQLPRLNRILMLKDLGLSLEQVGQMLNDDLQPEDMLRLLQIKRTELQHTIQQAQAQLTRLERRLKQIEMEGKMPDYQVKIKRIEPQQVLSIRQFAHDGVDARRLFAEVRQAVRSHNIKPSGPWIVLYHHAGYRDHDLDVEFAVPMEGDTRANVIVRAGQMSVRTIPLIETAVVALLQGSHDELASVYTVLNTYLHDHKHNYLGPAREVYLHGLDLNNTADCLIEIQYPIGEFTGRTTIDGVELPPYWANGLQPHLPLSRRARAAMGLARREAVALQQAEISPIHILLGLLGDRQGFAGHVLGDFGVTAQQVRMSLSHGSGQSSEPLVTDSARQVVSYADAEARTLGHDYIGTEHLLLALARQKEASLTLTTNGLNPEQIRTAVMQAFTR